MQQVFKTLLAQFKEFFKQLGPTKKASTIAVTSLLFIALVITAYMISGSDYVTLFTDIPSDQVSLIVEQMKKKNIPFNLTNKGNTIEVPEELLHSTQMTLMTELGTENIGTIGLELFDKQDFGITTYAQKINFQRALQGELIRAISTLEAVKNTKVILALPNKKTFLEEAGNPTASVIIELLPGKTLTSEQVKGIRYLVASAVENLIAENVTVVDSRGKMLSRQTSAATSISSELLEVKEKMERSFERKIEQILSRAVGQDKVIAKVDVTLNHKQQTILKETVDPDTTAIRSTQTEEESLNGARNSPSGVPGSRANLPGANANGSIGFNQEVKKELKTTNFEVPKTVTNIKEGSGNIERISVAVLVDGTYPAVNSLENKGEDNWVPRSEKELQKFSTIVRNAIGFNEQRGDVVNVENIPFQKENFLESEKLLNTLERKKFFRSLFKWGLMASALSLFFFLVLRPFMQWITESFQDSVDDMLPRTIEELEELQTVDNSLPGMTKALPSIDETIDPDKAECELLKDRIINLIEEDNDKASSAIGLWLIRKEV